MYYIADDQSIALKMQNTWNLGGGVSGFGVSLQTRCCFSDYVNMVGYSTILFHRLPPEVTSQIAESHFAVSQFAESILPNPKLPSPILPNILKNL